MVKSKILIALNDREIALAITAALRLLAKHYELHIFAREPWGANLGEQLNVHCCETISVMAAVKMIKEIAPVAVIGGLSVGNGNIDLAFLEAAARLKLPTIGILETAFMMKPLIKARLDQGKARPDTLMVASDLMVKQVMDFGWYKQERIKLVPMPKYQEALKLRHNPTPTEQEQQLRELNHVREEDMVIVYATSAQPEADCAALQLVVAALSECQNMALRLIFHPQDDVSLWENYQRLETSLWSELQAVSALVAGNRGLLMGVKSSLLFDVVLSGGKVVNINPGQNPEYRSPTAQLGLTTELVTTGDIRRKLINLQNGRWRGRGELPAIFRDENAPEHFVAELRAIIP